MHLWPSLRIRDSFKHAYLKKLEWNLHRMKSEKKSATSTRQKLLDNKHGVVTEEGVGTSVPSSKARNGFLLILKEILMVLSCCYCCFCCGGLFFSLSLLLPPWLPCVRCIFSCFILLLLLFHVWVLFVSEFGLWVVLIFDMGVLEGTMLLLFRRMAMLGPLASDFYLASS